MMLLKSTTAIINENQFELIFNINTGNKYYLIKLNLLILTKSTKIL